MTEATTTPDDTEATAPIVDALQTVSTSIAAFSKVSAGLAGLREAHPVNLVCAVDTPAGMKEAIAGRAAWREPRLELEQMRKAAKAPVLQLGKLIDSTAAGLEAELRIGESNYDDQIQTELTRKAKAKAEAEEAERVRVQAIKDRIASLFTSRPARLFGSSAEAIEAAIKNVVAVPLEGFDGFEDDAVSAQTHALEALRTMHATQVATEAREAEQARIAIEQAEAARVIAEQRAAFEAERAAHAAELERKAAALKAEHNAKEAAQRAEREKVEAAQRAESDRLAAERKALEDAQRAEADRLATIERQRLDDEYEAARAKQAQADAAERKRLDDEAAAERARLAEEAAQRDLEQQKAAAARQLEEDKAQAKRIAAEKKAAAKLATLQRLAPRMLAALKGCVAVADRETAEFIEARAVIAEAEGSAS